jgi:hypothetical protein
MRCVSYSRATVRRSRRRSFAERVGACAGLALACATLVAAAHAQPATVGCPPVSAGTQNEASVPTDALPTREQVIACVGSTPITGAAFAHWVAVARKVGETGGGSKPPVSNVSAEVMAFLISSDWVLGEARALGIAISEAKVRHTYEHIRRRQFHRTKAFKKFLKSSGQTPADLIFRVRLSLLSERLQKRVTAGVHGELAQQQALTRFAREFKARWTAQTYCEPAYATADCGHVQGSL